MKVQDLDATAIRIHLNELKSKFDMAMSNGEVFENLKKVYMEIKLLECQLKAMELQADKATNDGYYIRLQYPLL